MIRGKYELYRDLFIFFFFDRSKIFLKPSYSSSRANTRGCDSTRFLSSFSRCYGSLNSAAWSVNLYIFNTCYVSRNCFQPVNRFRSCGYYRNKMTRRFVYEMTYRRSIFPFAECIKPSSRFSIFSKFSKKIICRFQKKKEEEEEEHVQKELW